MYRLIGLHFTLNCLFYPILLILEYFLYVIFEYDCTLQENVHKMYLFTYRRRGACISKAFDVEIEKSQFELMWGDVMNVAIAGGFLSLARENASSPDRN